MFRFVTTQQNSNLAYRFIAAIELIMQSSTDLDQTKYKINQIIHDHRDHGLYFFPCLNATLSAL